MNTEQIKEIFQNIKDLTPEVCENLITLLTQYRIVDMIACCCEIAVFLGIISYTILKIIDKAEEY